MKRPKPVQQLTVAQFDALFPVGDEDACIRYLIARRWPEGVRCPRCGNDKVYTLASGHHWQCEMCAKDGYRFSHLAGTIFENTNKPLRDWFKITHLILTSKKGMSARQLGRYMGFGSVKTAWLMAHKIRTALIEPEEKLGGIVEVDETFIGGRAKNRHADKRDGIPGPTGTGKAIIAGAIRRKGNVVARVIANVRSSTLQAFVNEAVSHTVSLLCTDQWVGYHGLSKAGYPHATIDHAQRQYVVGAVHTNTIEGFRGHLPQRQQKVSAVYVAEFQFRYNNRFNADISEQRLREHDAEKATSGFSVFSSAFIFSPI
jgi:ISXO2-like transposase domain/Transposase zinc-ribbon domain